MGGRISIIPWSPVLSKRLLCSVGSGDGHDELGLGLKNGSRDNTKGRNL